MNVRDKADFFFYLGFLSRTFRTHRTAREGRVSSLTPLYQSLPHHKYLNISRSITIESSLLQIASSRTRTGNLWFPSGIDPKIIWYLKSYTLIRVRWVKSPGDPVSHRFQNWKSKKRAIDKRTTGLSWQINFNFVKLPSYSTRHSSIKIR